MRVKRLVTIGLALAAFAVVGLVTKRAIEIEATDGMATLAGKVLLVGFRGREPDGRNVRRVLEQARRGEIAGVMFLRRNVRDEGQVKRLTGALAGASDLPLLVSLDQEGGRVARLGWRSGFPRTPSALAVARSVEPERAHELYLAMAQGLRDWGFNLNFGPVVDLHRRDNPIIGRLGRSFGDDPDAVARYGEAFVRAHDEAGVLAAIKHFPGHGSSTGDTHLGTVDVTASWERRELRPFAVLAPQAPLVMTAHVVNRTLGGDVPATFSKRIVTDWLRGRLGFRGVVVSDDLQMDAISDRHLEEAAAERAMRAGVDLLLFANDRRADPDLVRRVAQHLAKVARDDAAFHERLVEAAGRVDALRDGLKPSSRRDRVVHRPVDPRSERDDAVRVPLLGG